MLKNMIYYDENQLPEILDRLCEHFPLKHRAVIMEAKPTPRVNVYTCEDGDVHVRVDPNGMNIAGYTLAGVFGYIIALTADHTEAFPTSLATYDIDESASKVMNYLKLVNPDFVKHFITHMPNMVSSWYEGNVHEALVTASPADFKPVPRPKPAPKKSDVFDQDAPMSQGVMHGLNQHNIFNAAFGATLVPPPLHPVEEPAN